MAWRAESHAIFDKNKGLKNKHAFRDLVERGDAHGCIALDGERITGWCSVGPRASFPYLVRTRVYRTSWDDATWSITCFVIVRDMRGKGIATSLARAAAEHAIESGAETVEGYPALTSKAGKPLPAVFAWTGVPAVFRGAGFEPHPDNSRVWRFARKL